ncbi:hypothetical protein LguiA_026413 [Lonicera macranthoides]
MCPLFFAIILVTLVKCSPVTKLTNSDTHSCIISFASLEILAFGSQTCFIIRHTLAIGSNFSCSSPLIRSTLAVGLDNRLIFSNTDTVPFNQI